MCAYVEELKEKSLPSSPLLLPPSLLSPPPAFLPPSPRPHVPRTWEGCDGVKLEAEALVGQLERGDPHLLEVQTHLLCNLQQHNSTHSNDQCFLSGRQVIGTHNSSQEGATQLKFFDKVEIFSFWPKTMDYWYSKGLIFASPKRVLRKVCHSIGNKKRSLTVLVSVA